MISDWKDAVLVGVIIIGLSAVVLLMFFANDRWNDCEQRGGTVVKTPSGYICAKIERV